MSYDAVRDTKTPLIGRPIRTKQDLEHERILQWRMAMVCSMEKPWELGKVVKGVQTL